jgi:acyl-CoA synthetase (AMP-forming)/AMP-acid ligase II
MNIAENILSQGHAAAPAVLSDDRIVTYGQLREWTLRIASILLARGHAKGERIGILSENSPFFVAAYLGIIRAGLVAVPLQTELLPQALERMALDAAMTEILVSSRSAKRVRLWSLQLPVLSEEAIKSLPSAAAARFPEIEPRTDLAALMFTSGSTGTPKGVMITHRNIDCNTRDIVRYMNLTVADRALVVLPFHYCFGLSVLHTHLMAGGSIALDNAFKLFPEQTLEQLQEKKCTGFAGVPSTYQILLRKTRFRDSSFPHLRWLQQAGGKLPDACIQELLDSFPDVRLFSMYGQTEGTARLSYLPPERLGDKLGSIGKGLPSTKLEVLRPDGEPVIPGSEETGEIVASGDNIAAGYWNDPDETAAFFRNGKLHTGDIARVDPDGFIFFVERERDMLKPGGNRVSAREVEEVIAEIPDVVEAAVVAGPHELLGESIWVYIVLRPGAGIGSEEIERHCRKRLPLFKLPDQIRLLKTLPHNSAGKILKSKLREMAKAEPLRESAIDRSENGSPSTLITTHENSIGNTHRSSRITTTS